MHKLTLIIGNKNYSSWSLRPWIFMKHHNLSFEERRVALYTEAAKMTVANYFSNGKVPILIDGDVTVWDSISILEYVSEKYLHNGGWPEDAAARASARSISAEMHSSFTAMRSAMPMNCRKQYPGFKPTPEAEKDIERIKSIWKKCRTEFGQEGVWLFGKFSIADAMYAPVAIRFNAYDIALEGVQKAYVQSLLTHPAMVEWIKAGYLETEVLEKFEIKV